MNGQGSEGYNWRTPEEVRGYVRTRPAAIAAAEAATPEEAAAAAEAAAASEDDVAAPPLERNSHAAAFLEGDLLIISGDSNGDLCKESCFVDTSNKVCHKELIVMPPISLQDAVEVAMQCSNRLGRGVRRPGRGGGASHLC